MEVKTEKFELSIPALDTTSKATVIQLEITLARDAEDQIWFITEESHKLIEDTRARYMGLVAPADFLKLRERFDLTQAQIGELFQVGEKSWTRWENGRNRPSRSLSLLVRAVIDDELCVSYLASQIGDPDWAERLCRKDRHEVSSKFRFQPGRGLFNRSSDRMREDRSEPVRRIAGAWPAEITSQQLSTQA